MTMIIFPLKEGVRPDHFGLIPSFLDEDDERRATEQFNDRYIGGWRKQEKFTLNKDDLSLKYPGDPPLEPLGAILFREEVIVLYQYDYVAVFQKDGTFEASRMD